MSRRITSMLSALAASAILATAAAAPAVAAPAGAHQAGTSGGGACLSAASSEVQRGLRQIGPPLGRKDLHWVLSSKSSARTPWCPLLMWAQFETSGGHGVLAGCGLAVSSWEVPRLRMETHGIRIGHGFDADQRDRHLSLDKSRRRQRVPDRWSCLVNLCGTVGFVLPIR